MTSQEFENIVQVAFDNLPNYFQDKVDNVCIVIEDYPNEEDVKKMKCNSKHNLLGLYKGIPKPLRRISYGMFPTIPDTIFIFQKNIEAICKTNFEIENKIREVLIHELAHYFGMNEEEVRNAGY